MKKFIVGIAVWLFTVIGFLNISYAALALVDASPTADDAYEINQMTPGSSKTFLGTRVRGTLFTGATTYAADDNGNPVANLFTTPSTTVFLKTTGAIRSESYRLGDGIYNQRLTIILVTDGGKDFTVTPKTKAGFTSIKMDDANDAVTLRYINDTVGWTIEGNNGASVT